MMPSASHETSAIFEVSTSLSSQSNPVGSFNEPSSSVIYSPTSTPKPVLRTEGIPVCVRVCAHTCVFVCDSKFFSLQQ